MTKEHSHQLTALNLDDLKFISDLGEIEFDNFVLDHPKTSLYQQSAWAKVKSAWQPYKTAVFYQNELVATALLLVRNLPLKQKMAYIPKGPLILENKFALPVLETVCSFYLKNLKNFAKSIGCFTLKIDFLEEITSFPYQDWLASQKKKNKKETTHLDNALDLASQDSQNKFDTPLVIVNSVNNKNLNGQAENTETLNKTTTFIKAFLANSFRHQGFSKDLHSTIQPRYQADIHKEVWEKYDRHNLKSMLNIAEKSYLKLIWYKGAELLQDEKLQKKCLNDFLSCLKSTENRQKINLRNYSYFQKIIKAFNDKMFVQVIYCDVEKLWLSLNQQKEQLLLEKDRSLNVSPKKLKKIEEDLSGIIQKIKKLEPVYLDAKMNNNYLLPAASNLFIASGKQVEMLYAGTEDKFAKYYAQVFSYCHAFDKLFNDGYTIIHLGGVSGFLTDGLSQFKGKFHCSISENLGEWDYSLRPINDHIFKFLLQLRKKIAKLR